MIRDPSDGTTKPPLTGLAALQAKYGPNWGLSIPETERRAKPAPTADELRDHYSKFSLGYQPKMDASGVRALK